MEKSRATIKRPSTKKISPAQAQKQREHDLNLDIESFLGPNNQDQDYQAPVVSEKEFKKLFEKGDNVTPPKANNKTDKTTMVKSFLPEDQYEILLNLTKSYNKNKERHQMIDCGDYLSLIFEAITNSGMIGTESSKRDLIALLKSVM